MASPASQSTAERISSFLAQHQRAVILSSLAVLAAAGGVGYYLYSTEQAVQAARKKRVKDVKEEAVAAVKGGEEEEWEDVPEHEQAGAGAKKRRKRKGGVKKRAEEAAEATAVVLGSDEDGPMLTEEQIKDMLFDDRRSLAASLKSKGNAAYQSRNFARAVDLYTRAIEISPEAEAVFFSNRAACYVNYSPPQYEKVIEDCDEALKLDKRYIKALNRRGGAYEALGKEVDALRDFTAATILEKFKNEQSAQSMERVLKKLANKRMLEIVANREPRLPSITFISSYLAAFRPHPPPELPAIPSQGDQTLILAFDALAAADYTHAFTLVNEAIDQGVSWPKGRAEALNLRGTFNFILGEAQKAKEDLLASLKEDPTLTQTWVKIASVHMELADPDSAFNAFELAIEYNKDDADIYYHRGQVHFIMGKYDLAAEDYQKSVALDPDFVFTHIQIAVAQYKQGNIASSMSKFRSAMRQFPQSSEPQNYYGELLLDQQRWQDAVERFDRAIELERKKNPARMNVLPLVNKALTIYQWKQDVSQAETLCREALEIDPECDAAIGTLAQFSLQMGRLETAVEMFKKGAEIARTAPDLENALTYQFATQAQMDFVIAYPEMASQLGALARGLTSA